METSTVAVRSAVQVLLVVCLAASAGIALFEALGPKGPAFATGIFIGLISGPLIWWACRQFRWNMAVESMTLWVTLNVSYGLKIAIWG